ncbi:MAG: hypothetical protein K6E69_08410 [Treponema sp.]|uniref:hypothetical protein n=1 Tax=Treponema sp. TaxID=166 RepID=UPI00298E67AB|nr:hypothetical protein [Treponema sp.]MCR5387129.1 hypothetical protein [Treponema sp.]
MKSFLKIISVLFFTSLITACTLPAGTYSAGTTGTESGTGSEKKDDLFVEDEESGEYVFDVNDKKYIRKEGYTVWTELYENKSDVFEAVECRVNKEYGYTEAGYGVVFLCGEKNGKKYLMTVLINSCQKYCIGKVENNEFKMIQNWTFTSNLAGGNGGIVNRIKVEYMTSGENKNKFRLLLNGEEETYFSDTDNMNPEFKGTWWGYAAVISPFDNFDISRVKVIYRK